jgi:hypothetical protein
VATDEQIRTRAWQLWEEAGRPEGRDEEFWYEAEKEVGAMEDLGEIAKEPPPSALPG